MNARINPRSETAHVDPDSRYDHFLTEEHQSSFCNPIEISRREIPRVACLDFVISLFLIIGCSLGVNIVYQFKSSRTGIPILSGPLIANPGTVDLGVVNQGAEVPFSFKIKNRGMESIAIKEVNRPCSCTRVSLREGDVIQPDAEIQVDGMISTTGMRHSFIGIFPITYISKNMESRATCQVKVIVDVVPTITLGRTKIDLHGINWQELKISHRYGDKFTIKSIEVSNPEIQWESVDFSLNNAGVAFVVKIRSKSPKWKPEFSSAWIKIHTNVKDDPEIQIPVSLSHDIE